MSMVDSRSSSSSSSLPSQKGKIAVETNFNGGFCRASIFNSLLGCVSEEANRVGVWDLGDSRKPIVVFDPDTVFPTSDGGGVHKNVGMCMDTRIIENPGTGRPYIMALYEGGLLATFDILEQKWMPEHSLLVNSGKGGASDVPLTFALRNIPNPTSSSTSGQSSQRFRGLCGGASNKFTGFEIDFSIQGNNEIIQASPIHSIEIPTIGGISQITTSPAQDMFISGGWDGRIRVFSAKTWKPLGVFTMPDSVSSCFESSEDKPSIRGIDAITSEDPKCRLDLACCIADTAVIFKGLYPKSV
jgi:hypothetical protein